MNDAAFEKVGADIVFQRRESFDVSFDRGFDDYEAGFGDFCGAGDFWLGLKKLHQKTQDGKWHLRLAMRTFSNYVLLWAEWTGTVGTINCFIAKNKRNSKLRGQTVHGIGANLDSRDKSLNSFQNVSEFH